MYVCLFASYLLFIYLFNVFLLKGIIPTTIVVRVAMAGTPNTARNKAANIESTMEFAFAETLPSNRISCRGDSKETIV